MEADWDRIKNFVKKSKDLQHIGVANVTGKAIAGLFWFYMASLLGAENYGQVTYFVAIGSMAAALSMIGSANTLIVYTAKKIPIQPPIYFITLILGTISAIIVFLIFHNWIISVYTVGYVIFNLAISYLLGKKYYKKYSLYFVIQKILFVGFSVVLYFTIGPIGVVLGFALSFLVFTPIIIESFRVTKLDFKILKKRFGFMMNSFALSLERIFMGQVDKIIIAPMFGFSLLGNFALGIQFLSVMFLLPAIVYQYTLSQDASGNPSYTIKKLT